MDFYSIYSGSKKYSDTFTPNSDALYWRDMDENMSSKEQGIKWTRASEAFPDLTLFGPNGVGPDDIVQGELGNCWFLAACATMAQIPGTIEKMFLNPKNELSKNGIYGVNFYSLGVPLTVLVDDYLPLSEDSAGNKSTLFAGIGEDSSLWVPMMEKAFAKYHGNYSHIVGGDARMAARTMNNAPFDIVHHRKDLKMEALWKKMSEHHKKGHILMAGTPGSDDSYENDWGLVFGHAYNVLGVKTLSDGQRLVKM